MSRESRRIPSLDGIRAISISLVILCHFGRDIGWGDPFDLGSLGVRIFFVISGYLITGLLMRELEADGGINLGRFYFRRTLRIFPAFYAYLGIMLLVASFGWARLSIKDALPAITYTSNYFANLAKDIEHTWSLSTEEQFYLVWPVVFALSGRRRGIYALLALLVVAPLSSAVLSSRLGHPVPAFFNSPIGVGCLLALVRESAHRLVFYRRWIGSSAGLLLVAVIFYCNAPQSHSLLRYNFLAALLLNISIALWLDWAVSNADTLAGRLLNSPWMVSLGVLSYSLYLWQQPFLALHTANPGLYLEGYWTVIASPPVRFGIIALLACASYFLIEKPMLRLRGRLERMLFAEKTRAESASVRLGGHVTGQSQQSIITQPIPPVS